MSESRTTEEQVCAPVSMSFKLLTNGEDDELDVLHICVESFKLLDGDQIGRVLDYLQRRYTRG